MGSGVGVLAATLAVVGVCLAGPVSTAFAGAAWAPRTPRAALVLWQAICLGAGLSMVGSLLLFAIGDQGGNLPEAIGSVLHNLWLGRPFTGMTWWQVASAVLAVALAAHLLGILLLLPAARHSSTPLPPGARRPLVESWRQRRATGPARRHPDPRPPDRRRLLAARPSSPGGPFRRPGRPADAGGTRRRAGARARPPQGQARPADPALPGLGGGAGRVRRRAPGECGGRGVGRDARRRLRGASRHRRDARRSAGQGHAGRRRLPGRGRCRPVDNPSRPRPHRCRIVDGPGALAGAHGDGGRFTGDDSDPIGCAGCWPRLHCRNWPQSGSTRWRRC